jgi:hypothetical protein
MIRIISFKNKINLLVGNLLLSKYFVFIFHFFFNKKFINYYNFKILTKGIDKKNYVRLLFSFYEKAEIYLINKYFADITGDQSLVEAEMKSTPVHHDVEIS